MVSALGRMSAYLLAVVKKMKSGILMIVSTKKIHASAFVCIKKSVGPSPISFAPYLGSF
jgi:hypothetical protein